MASLPLSNARTLAGRLYRDDTSRAPEVPVEQDGARAYDGWVRAAATAGDSDTSADLDAVDRAEFAAAWDDLIETDASEAHPAGPVYSRPTLSAQE